MMSTNICNYLFQIVTSRLLSVNEYGTINTLMSLIVYFSIPNTIISMISARYIALYHNTSNQKSTVCVIHFLLKCGVAISLVIGIIGGLFASHIANLLHLDNHYLIYGCAAVAVVNVSAAVMYGILQGLQFFLPYGIQGLINALCKLLGSAGLILLGYHVGGVIAAMTVGGILTVLYCAFCIRHSLAQAVRYRGDSSVELHEFIRFASGTIVAQSCITALTNGDILLVKALFSDAEAGTYSSAMVIGKISMYVSTAVIAALFPMVVEEHDKRKDTRRLFAKALLYGGGSSLAMALGMILLGKYVIEVLFGQKYLDATCYLPAVCIFVVPLTFLTVIMNYVLAIDRVGFFAVSVLVSTAIMLVMVGFFHTDVVQVMTICGVILSADVIVNLIAIPMMHAIPTR